MKGKVGGQWNKIFMDIFRSMSRGFLLLSPVSLTELCSFWYGLKDLFTLHKLAGIEDITWPCGDTKFCISKRPYNVLFII